MPPTRDGYWQCASCGDEWNFLKNMVCWSCKCKRDIVGSGSVWGLKAKAGLQEFAGAKHDFPRLDPEGYATAGKRKKWKHGPK